MAESFLQRLAANNGKALVVTTDKSTKKTLESMDDTLQKIYKQEVAQDKKDNKEKKKAAQATKRKSGDASFSLFGKDKNNKKKAEKEGKGFLSKLLGKAGLAGLLLKGGVLSAAIVTLLGGAIVAYIASPKFRKAVNTATKKVWEFSRDNILIPGWNWIKKKGPEAFNWIVKEILDPTRKWLRKEISDIGRLLRESVWKALPKWMRGGGTPQDKDDAGKFRDSTISKAEEILTGSKPGEKTQKVRNVFEAAKIAESNAMVDQLRFSFNSNDDAIDKEKQEFYKEAAEGVLSDAKKKNKEMDLITKELQDAKTALEEMGEGGDPRLRDFYEKKLNDNLANSEVKKKQLLEVDKQIAELRKKELKLLEKEAKVKGFKTPTQSIFAGYQTGGPIKVPGSGTGDKVPMMLPPGSFVMNRNAAGFQTGGMVPTMLEPGEDVYGPGQWNGMHQMMNSLIPRFQNGGEVNPNNIGDKKTHELMNHLLKDKSTHKNHSHKKEAQGFQSGGEVTQTQSYDTGSGYQPAGATDAQGRPVVLSKVAAESFAKMLAESDGAVRGSDVASSSRSAEKNAAVGGVSNSAHLYGEAIDIHGGSQSWMKANGHKYGWELVDYSGSHGGHFRYVGEGAGQHDGSAGGGDKGGGGGIMSSIGGVLSGIGGQMGDLLKGLMGAFSEVFGEDMQALFGGISSLFSSGGGGGGGQSFGDVSASSDPLTGDTQAKAKAMYEYIKGKGYSDAQARGMVVNIQRESNFDATAASGDDGGAGGLFQWKGSRQTSQVQQLVGDGNWKGQIDYALQEDAGPRYKSETANMSPHQAADWWMNEWERPADPTAGSAKHASMLQGLGFQKGGIVNMKGSASSNQRFEQAQEKFADRIAEGIQPVVVPMPSGGSTQAPTVVQNSGSQTDPPNLPNGPSSLQAAEYLYRLNMANAF